MKNPTRILIAVALIAVACFAYFKFSGQPHTEDAAPPAQKTLFENNTIQVGFISYPPGFIVDPNTKEKSGIFNDLLVEIAKRNHLTINYKEEVTWATMIESLKSSRVDLIANPVWATNERRAHADFSIPVYFSPIGIYVRANDDRFTEDPLRINSGDVRIAGVDGEINGVIAKADFPKAELILFPNNIDVAQLFLEIQSGKKDVTFAEPMFAYDYMKANPNKLKNIAVDRPVRNYPNSFMFDQGHPELKSFLDAEIQKLIDDGFVDRTLVKYAPFEGAVISATDPRAIERQ